MEMWFSEFHTPDVKHSIRVNRQLYSKQSDYQRIDIFETPEFGRVLTLDGNGMLTERDEFIYDEMITHVPMSVHRSAKDILVIGAGDGGVVCDDDDGASVLVIDILHELQDFLGRLIVERARGLVAKKDLRIFRERAGDRNSLLLASRQLGGKVFKVIRKSHFFYHLCGGKRIGRDLFYKRHVFVDGQRGHEVVELKNKAHGLGSVLRELVCGKL